MIKCIKIKDFVISINKINNAVEPQSIGVIKAINTDCAIVFFVGKNETLRTSFDVEKTGKGFSVKICNICHVVKNTK